MSKHNRDRRRQMAGLRQAYKGGATPSPKPSAKRKVLRVAITRTLELVDGRWVPINDNLDCGGMPTADAAVLAYQVAAAVMQKLAEAHKAKELANGQAVAAHSDRAPGIAGGASGEAAGHEADGVRTADAVEDGGAPSKRFGPFKGALEALDELAAKTTEQERSKEVDDGRTLQAVRQADPGGTGGGAA
jgi:hypothetical protein